MGWYMAPVLKVIWSFMKPSGSPLASLLEFQSSFVGLLWIPTEGIYNNAWPGQALSLSNSILGPYAGRIQGPFKPLYICVCVYIYIYV